MVLLVSVYFLLATLTLFIEQRIHFFLILIFLIFFLDLILRNETRTDALVCSLPVSRRLVVFSRFLTAALIFLLVVGTTYLAAFLVRFFLGSFVMKPVDILGAGDLVIVISLYAMNVSTALLVFFGLGYPGYPLGLVINIVSTLLIWTGVSGILYLATSLASSDWSLTIARKSRIWENLADYLPAIIGRGRALWGPAVTLAIFVFFAILCIFISLVLGEKFYRKKDIYVSESDLDVM
jgi:hypothetical protein